MTTPDPHTLDRIIAWLEPWGPDTPHHEAVQALKALRAENERMAAIAAALAHPAAWQTMDSAPHDVPIIAWWPIVALDDNGDPTETVEDGRAVVTEWNGGYWLEPDVLNAMGEHMGDDSTYADSPSHWLWLPPAPLAEIAAKEGEGAHPPENPTEEMIAAALALTWEDNEDERGLVINIWHAMNAAAPKGGDNA